MEYLTVKEIAEKWGVSERAIRKYCASSRIEGVKREGGVWLIPKAAKKPEKTSHAKNLTLLQILRREDKLRTKGGIYHKVQIKLTYNSTTSKGVA